MTKIALMPVPQRIALFERLEAHGFGEYELISEWLATLGHQIGKSALQEYVSQNRALIETELKVAREASAAALADRKQFRMRCLEVAVQIAGPVDVMVKADELLRWLDRDDEPAV